MNQNEWRRFYSTLRQQMRLGWSINTFGMDFSISLCIAIPNEVRRHALGATGFQARLWDLALTLYGLPPEEKLEDWYCPLTDDWRRCGWLLKQRCETRGEYPTRKREDIP